MAAPQVRRVCREGKRKKRWSRKRVVKREERHSFCGMKKYEKVDYGSELVNVKVCI